MNTKILAFALLLWTAVISSVHGEIQDPYYANKNCICFDSSGSLIQTRSVNPRKNKVPLRPWIFNENGEAKWSRKHNQRNKGLIQPWDSNNNIELKSGDVDEQVVKDSVKPENRNIPLNQDLIAAWTSNVNEPSDLTDDGNHKGYQHNHIGHRNPWLIDINEESWKKNVNQERASIHNVKPIAVDPTWKGLSWNDDVTQQSNLINDMKTNEIDSFPPWNNNVNHVSNTKSSDWESNEDYVQSWDNDYVNQETKNPWKSQGVENSDESDLQNLSVRPILIGKTMGMKHFIRHYNNGELPLHSQTPYTQTVLITRNNPFQILGTMPLGKAFLPNPVLANQSNGNHKVSRSRDENNLIDLSPTGEDNFSSRFMSPIKLFSDLIKFLGSRSGNDMNNENNFDEINDQLSDKRVASQYGNFDENDVSPLEAPLLPASEIIKHFHDSYNSRSGNDINNENNIDEIDLLPLGEEQLNSRSFIEPRDLHKILPRWINSPSRANFRPAVRNLRLGRDGKVPDASTGNDVVGWSSFGKEGLDSIPPESIHPEIYVENQTDDDLEGNNDNSGDFRIIGGNAATGSGTPLNNKGRSGYII